MNTHFELWKTCLKTRYIALKPAVASKPLKTMLREFVGVDCNEFPISKVIIITHAILTTRIAIQHLVYKPVCDCESHQKVSDFGYHYHSNNQSDQLKIGEREKGMVMKGWTPVYIGETYMWETVEQNPQIGNSTYCIPNILQTLTYTLTLYVNTLSHPLIRKVTCSWVVEIYYQSHPRHHRGSHTHL